MQSRAYHDHLVCMLGCITTADDPILVLEFCEHGDLQQYLRQNRDAIKVRTSRRVHFNSFFQRGDKNCTDENGLLLFAFQASDALVEVEV